MWDVIKEFGRFCWRRDCESAQCLMIVLGSFLSLDGKRDMGSYFKALYEADKVTRCN